MTMKLYRPTPDGGLEPAPVEQKDHRRKLRSRRWDAAELANPEADVTNPWIAVAAIVGHGGPDVRGAGRRDRDRPLGLDPDRTLAGNHEGAGGTSGALLIRGPLQAAACHGYLPWHFLYFMPEPQKHGSLRPTLGAPDWTPLSESTVSSPFWRIIFVGAAGRPWITGTAAAGVTAAAAVAAAAVASDSWRS